MLSSRANVIMWDDMLSFEMKCYHLECYHLELILSSGANVIMWDEMLSSGANVIIWDEMLSCGSKCCHLFKFVLKVPKNFMFIWCYHAMLSCGMITYPFLLFLKTSLPNLFMAFVSDFLTILSILLIKQ